MDKVLKLLFVGMVITYIGVTGAAWLQSNLMLDGNGDFSTKQVLDQKNDGENLGISPTGSGLCIISVDGQKYDVTVFKNRHSGGDMFECGQDMSQTFHNQHNQDYLRLMTRYRIK